VTAAPHNFDRMSYDAEEYRTARKCAELWNDAKCPTDRQAIEWTLFMGGALPLVEVRDGTMYARGEMTDVEVDHELKRSGVAASPHHRKDFRDAWAALCRIPLVKAVPVPIEFVRDIVVRPWTDAPTEEEAHAKAMQMREVF
jgi:hypothetical protein